MGLHRSESAPRQTSRIDGPIMLRFYTVSILRSYDPFRANLRQTKRRLAAIMVGLIISYVNPAFASELTVTKSAKIEDAPYVPKPKGTLTFTKDIAPIIFNNCSSCHRTGEVAPFTLLNYDDVKKKGKTIVKVIDKRYM